MRFWMTLMVLLAVAPALAQDQQQPAAVIGENLGKNLGENLGENVREDVRATQIPGDRQETARPAIATPAATVAPAPAPADGGTASIETVEKPIVCYSARETGDRVARLRLHNPLLAMQTHARRLRAEPLRTRLCRSAGRMIYELSLIRRDGKVHVVYLNAQTGKPMAGPRN